MVGEIELPGTQEKAVSSGKGTKMDTIGLPISPDFYLLDLRIT